MIRLLEPDDVDLFRRIRLEALRMEPDAFASTAEQWEALPEEEWRRRLTDNPVFGAFDGNEIVGLMGLWPERAVKTAHRATIIMVYVRSDRRGGGFAKALLAAVNDYARQNGVRQLELTVSAENPAAVRFYEREGFRQIGLIPGGFLQGDREVDEVLMARRTGG